MSKGLIYTVIPCWLILAILVAADTDTTVQSGSLSALRSKTTKGERSTSEKLLGDVNDGSRAIPVHLIPLLDEEGQKIIPEDEPLLPFSTRQTCGSCHDYEKISKGWHFNAVDPNVAAGRPGQPWIFVDPSIATQVAISYRPWPGTFRPQQLGLSSWKFVQLFGRHTPGGGPGELESDLPDEKIRQFVSGKLEINCMSCHSADPAHDQVEYAIQIARQNLRWAAAATCSFASVSGVAKDMPNTYDYLMPPVLDDPKLRPPTITYRQDAFDHKNRVFFDIVRKVPDQRCYFCHSNMDINKDKPEQWMTDEDVHLTSGLTCVDCHRHGLDHNIVRGYESEGSASSNPLAATSSCEGCHSEGRLGAPVPEHPGIPPIHFDKLTCTACHSGRRPTRRTVRTKTSRAHALGIHNLSRADEALPHIIYPVFAKQQNGKIAPCKLIWPAFWGSMKEQKVTPITIDTVRRIVGKIITKEKLSPSGDWPVLTEELISQALNLLAKTIEDKPVYICGGELYTLNEEGKLISAQHTAASPYLWPIAHDVRPAAQSLGAYGCQDCHSIKEAFFFGEVAIDSPLAWQRGLAKKMIEFQDIDAFYTKAFALSFMFRPWLKIVALGSCAILAAVLLLYGLKALACVAKILVSRNNLIEDI